MENYQRLTESEKQLLKEYADFINQIAEHSGHIFNKKDMFQGIKQSLKHVPMLNGHSGIIDFYNKIESLNNNQN